MGRGARLVRRSRCVARRGCQLARPGQAGQQTRGIVTCRWFVGDTRSDGRMVPSYCRAGWVGGALFKRTSCCAKQEGSHWQQAPRRLLCCQPLACPTFFSHDSSPRSPYLRFSTRPAATPGAALGFWVPQCPVTPSATQAAAASQPATWRLPACPPARPPTLRPPCPPVL